MLTLSNGRKPRLNPMVANKHRAGFAAGSDRRIARGARAEQRAIRRAASVAKRNPISKVSASTEEDEHFAERGLIRLKIHMVIGNWPQFWETAKALETEWHARRTTASAPCADHGETLARHITELRIPTRIVGMLERAGFTTAGTLLAGFPKAFVGRTQFGLGTMRIIADALIQAGLLSASDADEKITAWRAAEKIGSYLADGRAAATT